jgi:rfaE bifunctional protein nucleotidyltransferase chain/domain
MKINAKLLQKIANQKKLGKKIVLVTGVFDVLHQEHVEFLTKAKGVGDFLMVGLESDVRVKKMKGEDRPINNEVTRVKNLASLSIADWVFLLPEKFDNPLDREKLIIQLQPDILAVSSHTNHLDKKRAIMEKFGGQLLVVLKHNPQVSSTIIINDHRGK